MSVITPQFLARSRLGRRKAIMNTSKKFCRRKLHTQRFVAVSVVAAVTTSIWLYSRGAQTQRGEDQRTGDAQLNDDFDKYLAHRKRDTVEELPRGLLDVYGLQSHRVKPEAWSTMEKMAKAGQVHALDDTLLSAALFEENGRFQFSYLEPLAGHIDQTLKEYQRFLMNDFIQLQLLVRRFPDVRERRLLENRMMRMASHSREYNRILRKEMKDFMVRTGLARFPSEALYKLKLKVQAAIEQRQAYPCSRAVKCKLTNPYGFASGIHDVLWCLIRGFQDNRRVVIDTTQWHYVSDNFTWTESFRSLDTPGDNEQNCSSLPDDPNLPGPNGQARASLHSIPVDVAETLVRHHQDPYAWWFGQFVGYILRPSSITEELVQQAKELLGFKSPIVGLHIRRTDKFSEAAYHDVEEYMEHAEEYYRNLGAQVPKRVFVATDEPRVLDDLRDSFPDFVFISNARSAELANDLDMRDLPASLQGLIIDLFLLAQTDKLVCTLSSGVCRIAYELMQARRTDASDQLVSLDVSYFYAYVAAPPRQAIYSHEPVQDSGLYLSVGDCVARTSDTAVVEESVKKGAYDGFSVGIICGSNLLAGKYPTYKTLPTVRVNATRISLL